MCMDRKILMVPKNGIDRVYDISARHIERAMKYGGGELWPEDVKEHLLEGRKQLWIVVEGNIVIASIVTEIATYPRKKVVRILMIGGDRLTEWGRDLHATLEKWAKRIGANSIEIIGRKGWERLMKEFGYKAAYTYLKKEVEHE